ncbi:hypothetical protein [Hymenobacter glacieicola]|uniref:DUF3945 domain-containing protein n=1 Tax=Hymenobacter glacieicola TaxID=1562124 RepID=A0ABQ1X5V9_9BACT|nr:hypothetical protein [Hymenobacter glacieicola]GGG61440.1 hypothetical protein GCM10011378_41860 [Hymenobacter glacieicola]
MLLSNSGSVPLGQAGSGAAYVLNPDRSAVSTLERGAALRASRAQQDAIRRQKQLDLDAKELDDRLKYKTNTGRLFQPSFDEQVVPDLQKGIAGLYNPAAGISRFQRSNQSNQLTDRAESIRTMGEQKDKFLTDYLGKLRSDPTRNFDGGNALLQDSLRDATGRRLRADEYDELDAVRKFETDYRTYNPQQVALASMKGLLHDDYNQTSDAGYVGGKHFSDVLQSRLVKVGKDGRAVLNADGTPALDTQKYFEAAYQEGSPLKIVIDGMKADYDKQRAQDPSLPKKGELGFFNELVAPLAKVNYRHTEGLNAQPKSAGKGSGSDSGYEMDGDWVDSDYEATVQTGVQDQIRTHATFMNGNQVAPTFDGGREVTGQKTQYANSFPTFGKGPRALFKKKSGEKVPIHVNSIQFAVSYQDNGRGQFTRVVDSKRPLSGEFGEQYLVTADAKTGEILYPKNQQEAEQMVRSGRAVIQPAIEFASDKNERFQADYSNALKALKEQNAFEASSDASKIKPEAILEIEARKLVSQGVQRTLVPYNAQNAVAINGVTGGQYRAGLARAKAAMAKLRAAAPARSTSTSTKKKTTGITW